MATISITPRDVARELARRYSTMTHDELDLLESILVPKKYSKNEMILRESKDKTILGYSTNIKIAGANLLSIVNDVLDFSKIEAGKMELLPDNYEVSSLIIDLVNHPILDRPIQRL